MAVAPASRERRSRRAIAAALEAVEAMGEGRPLRPALASALRTAEGLGPKERRHAALAARGVARWLRICDAALGFAQAPRVIPADRALLRYLAWRVSVLGEPPDAVAADLALPGPRRPRAIGDDALREVARALPPLGEAGPLTVFPGGAPIAPPSDPAVALALRQSVPDFFAERLIATLGREEAEACLRALNREARLTLRVNASRVGRSEALAALAAAGIAASPGEGPLAIAVEDRAGLFDAQPFRRGLVEVQDEGSQAVVELCRPEPGQRWLDYCAGTGGKSLALAAAGAVVTAWDASATRLAELPRRAHRAGVRVEVARAEPGGTFDGVLVDAPCSGSGAIQREPDARWRVTASAVERFQRAQLDILGRAAGRVARGGALVYAVCSLFPEEGEAVVERFRERNPELALEESTRRWPHRTAGAGFFLARLVRARTAPRPRAAGR